MQDIEISPRLATWRRRTDIPLLLLAVGSLPLLLLEVVANRLPNGDQKFLKVRHLGFFTLLLIYVLILNISFTRPIGSKWN